MPREPIRFVTEQELKSIGGTSLWPILVAIIGGVLVGRLILYLTQT